MGKLAIKKTPVNQSNFTIGKLATDVQTLIMQGRYFYGIHKDRVAFLIQHDFEGAINSELILTAKFVGLYLFEFEEKYNLTLTCE